MKNEIICLIIGFLLAFLLLLCYGNYRAGDESINDQLEQIGNNQSTITESINKSENRIENIESGIGETGTIIEDCKRILENIRKRDEEKRKQIENAT